MAAYCEVGNLLTGDIRLAGKYGDGSQFVQLAADEIDSQIGHKYVTPVVFDESTPEAVALARPAKLLLKKINILLASGRIVLDMAAGGEDRDLHAYGANMVKEALGLLKCVQDGDILLTGAPLLTEEATNENTAVSIVQEDAESLVAGFYTRYSTPVADFPFTIAPLRPYDSGASV